jgi:hypothetical protein
MERAEVDDFHSTGSILQPIAANCHSVKQAPLFQPGDAPDEAYCSLRDKPHCAEWKRNCESLWSRHRPYADPNFLRDIRCQLHPRFWEMYLTVAFLDRGYELHKHADGGPEFGIEVAGRRYWFDAIAPGPGTGPDAVPPGPSQEQLLLRYLSALETKRQQWKKDLERGRVCENDGYIVAINDRGIDDWSWTGSTMPYIVHALYGLGHPVVLLNRQTGKTAGSGYQHRPAISKLSSATVSSQCFAASECPEISAALYSSVNAANYPSVLGEDFMVLHNTDPAVPLPAGALHCAGEYRFDDEGLHMRHAADAGPRDAS